MQIKKVIAPFLPKLIIVLLFASKLVFANAESDNTQLSGIWSGTIGSSKITACFKNDHSGFYYYNRYAYPIAIEKTKNSNLVFHETAGDWLVDSKNHNNILGSWIRTKDKKNLKIELQKIKSDDKNSFDCSDDIFVNRIMKNISKSSTARKITNDINAKYITISLPETDTFSVSILQLTGDSPIVNKINAILEPQNNLDYYVSSMKECIAFSLLEEDARVVYNEYHTIAGDYLNVHSDSDYNYCNTNHNISHGENSQTINIKTGEKENLISWFKDSEVRDGTSVRLSEDLLEFIFERLDSLPQSDGLTTSEREECYADSGSEIMLSISNVGFKFELPPTSNYSCGESIDIPFKDLRPFLNDYGIQAVNKLESTQR